MPGATGVGSGRIYLGEWERNEALSRVLARLLGAEESGADVRAGVLVWVKGRVRPRWKGGGGLDSALRPPGREGQRVEVH